MEKSKILVQAVTPIMNRLNEKIKAIGLRRDTYLNTVFWFEANKLAEDLSGKCNSSKAREYLLFQLRTLPTTPVSITLDKDVIAAIDTSCAKINVPRDCFVNRVFFFLAAEAKHLKAARISIELLIKHATGELGVNALDNASEFLGDPFYELRCFMRGNESSLYEWEFFGKVEGLNCYLEDTSVPESKEHWDFDAMLSSI